MRPKKQITPAHRQQLEDAREALANSGKSPRRIADESRLAVLDWIYRWGYTSSPLIQVLLAKTSGGYALKLSKQGWLSATRTESGMPPAFFTLTVQGLEEACHHTSGLYRYPETDPYRVDQRLIRHNLLAQKITINALETGAITRFETERMFLVEGDKSGVKHPDIVWITDSGLRIGIEVELSAKWDRDLDEFILGILRALRPDNNIPAQYSRFLIVSDSQAIIDRYKKAMSPGSKLNAWKKNQRKHWLVDHSIAIPDWLIEKIDFQLIDR